MLQLEKFDSNKRLPLNIVAELLNIDTGTILLWLVENDKSFHYVSKEGETKLCHYEDGDRSAIKDLLQNGKSHILWSEDADHHDGGHITGIFEEIDREDLLITVSDAILLRDLSESFGIKVESEQEKKPLIGTTFFTGWKEIANALNRCIKTAKTYCKKKGLKYIHNPAGQPTTTQEEIDIWRNTLPSRKN